MDKLEIKELIVFAHHGVFPSEKMLGQKFILNVTVAYDMTNAAVNRELTESIHYGELSAQLIEWCQSCQEDLIETVAFQLIANIFETYPIAQKITLELQKPWAPVHLPLQTCAVTLTRQKRHYFIGLGTNMGEKNKQLDTAIAEMTQRGLTVLKSSNRLVTEAWGGVEQDDFLNQVVEVESYFEPLHVLSILQSIEQDMGRVREIKWGPRCIDLDILLIDNDIIQNEHLIVPHPYMCEREFVLEPLAEIAPFAIHPVERKAVRTLLEQLRS